MICLMKKLLESLPGYQNKFASTGLSYYQNCNSVSETHTQYTHNIHTQHTQLIQHMYKHKQTQTSANTSVVSNLKIVRLKIYSLVSQLEKKEMKRKLFNNI